MAMLLCKMSSQTTWKEFHIQQPREKDMAKKDKVIIIIFNGNLKISYTATSQMPKKPFSFPAFLSNRNLHKATPVVDTGFRSCKTTSLPLTLGYFLLKELNHSYATCTATCSVRQPTRERKTATLLHEYHEI